jgi:hypothetical protein
MAYPDDFTVAEQKQLFRELQELDRKRSTFRATATPQFAQAVGDLAQYVPQAEASLIEPLARAVADGQLTMEQAQTTALETEKIVLSDPTTYEKDKPKGGFLSRLQDSVMDKVKWGSRWTFAAANLAPQLVTNIGSRVVGGTIGSGDQPGGVYERPETGFFDGWFASTDLGSMLSGEDYGEGFFIGEDALKYQQEQAKRYRGTVGDGGWTFGRGLASTFMQPGSREYNILSGLVDAGAALAVPSIPFVSQIGKAARVTRQAAGIGLRSTAGLADFGNAQIIASRVSPWLDSADGSRVIDHLVDNVNDYEVALNTFSKNAPNTFLRDIINITGESAGGRDLARTQMRELLEQNLGKSGLSSTTDLDLRAAGTKIGELGERWAVGRAARRTRERLGAPVGPNQIALDFSDEYAKNDSLRKALGIMQTLRVDEYRLLDGTTRTRTDLLDRLAQVVNLDNPGDFRGTMDEIDQMIAYGISRSKRSGRKIKRQAEKVLAEGGDEILETLPAGADEIQQAAYVIMRRFRDQQESHLFGSVAGDNGQGTIFGLGNVAEIAATETMDDLLEGTGLYLGASTSASDNLLTGTRVLPDGTEETGMFMAPLDTAGVLGEQRRYAAVLPDIRALRRETSKIAWMFTSKARDAGIGDANKFVTLLDFVQNRVWRTGTLMTGGYAIRNISESMVRSAMAPGIRTGPAHPIEWIMAMTKRRGFGTIDGLQWTDEALSTEAAKLMREYAQATGATMREALDATSLQYKAYQTGAWRIANRSGDRAYYRQGVQDQIHLLAEDPVIRQIAQGRSTQEIIEWMRTTDEGRGAVRALQARWSKKRPAGAEKNVRVTYDFVNSKGELNSTNLEKVIDLYFRQRLIEETGNSPQLKKIIATFDEGGLIDLPDGTSARAFKVGELGGGQAMPGVPELLGYDPAFARLVDQLIDDDVTNLPFTVKHRVHANARGLGVHQSDKDQLMQGFNNTVQHFFTNVFGKKEAFLNRSPAFRQFYYAQVRNLTSRLEPAEAQKIIDNIKDAYVDEAGELYKTLLGIKPEDGVYRVGAELLDEAEYTSRFNAAKATRDAKLEGFSDQWARRYLGGGTTKERITNTGLWDELKARAAGETQPTGARFTAEEVSLAARSYAAEEVQKLFYNASETSNLADIMRIISPFGQAWAEVMGAWYKQVLKNPNRLKNMSVTFRGVRDMDPDGDGKGFLYTDPITGEMMFNYPFVPGMSAMIFGVAGGLAGQTILGRSPIGMAGAGLAGLAAGGTAGAVIGGKAQAEGLSPMLAAPIKSANMALNVLPSVGPVVQIAANQILPDKPQFDDLRSFLLPFGTVEPTPGGLAEQLTPSWAKKLIEAISADPDTDRMFGDLYIDVYRALVATGEFDLNNPDDVREIDARSKSSARSLLMMRSIGQFVGPARPDVVLNVPTKFEGEINLADIEKMNIEGNIPNNVLSKVFRTFQEEDYDTAVLRFFETFGDDTLMYMVGSTTAISRGLDASKEFGDWERENGAFKSAHDNVFGYFSTVGSQFDLETYLRQLRSGDRERRTDPLEMYRQAEAVVGRALYRQATRQFGPDPSKGQTNMLRQYKAYLQTVFPGYATQPFDIKERTAIIMELENAARDQLVTNNEVAIAARTYFDERNRAIEIANSRRELPALGNPLSGDKNADLRAYLRYIGEKLVDRYSDFDRMFSRELFNEIDIDA